MTIENPRTVPLGYSAQARARRDVVAAFHKAGKSDAELRETIDTHFGDRAFSDLNLEELGFLISLLPNQQEGEAA